MRRRRFGGVVQILVASVAFAAVAWVGIAGSLALPGKHRSAKRPEPATRLEVEVALARLGFTPQSVAAAGFTAAQITDIVGATASSLRDNIASLRAADIAAGQARTTIDRLTRLIQSGLSTEQDRTALAAAQTALTSAQAEAQSVLNTAYFAGAANLGAGARAVLETLAANTAWDVPIQYRAANRPEPDWVQLRDALANQRIAAFRHEDPDPNAQQLLATANADPAVSAAAANLNALPTLRSAWDQAVGL